MLRMIALGRFNYRKCGACWYTVSEHISMLDCAVCEIVLMNTSHS